jgi:hypothetical protein
LSELRQREVRLRLPKLLSSAEGQACANCGSMVGVVAAHCNDLEFKGIGRKAPDALVAFLCVRCHDICDGRAGGLALAEKRAIWDRSFKRTVVRWFQSGIVKVN